MTGKIPDYSNKPASGFLAVILMLLLIPAAVFLAGFAFVLVVILAALSAAGLALLIVANRFKNKGAEKMNDSASGEIIEGESILIKTETVSEDKGDAGYR